jgi:TPR repeat protein
MSKANDYEPDFNQLVELFDQYQSFPSVKVLEKLDVLADRGSMQSMVYIGVAYRDGYGVEKNQTLAESYFVRAFEAENDIADYYLAKLYMSQERYQELFKVLSTSAKYKFAPTLNCLGHMYLNGYGVDRDIYQSRELFEEASKLGNIWGSRNLGRVYMSGKFGIFKKFYGYYLMWAAILRGAIIYSKNNSDERMLG